MSIHKEAWFSIVSDDQQLEQLRQKVRAREEDAVLPYLNYLNRTNKMTPANTKELGWLKQKADRLYNEVVVPYWDEYYYLASLLGDGSKNEDPDSLWRLNGELMRAVNTATGFASGHPLATNEWVIKNTEALLRRSKQIPKLKRAFERSIERALEIRNRSPEAIAFAPQYKGELAHIREVTAYLEEIQRRMTLITDKSKIYFMDYTDPETGDDIEWEDREWRGLTEGEAVAEMTDRANTSIDYLTEEMEERYLEPLLKNGFPRHGLLADASDLLNDIREVENAYDTLRYYVQGLWDRRALVDRGVKESDIELLNKPLPDQESNLI